MESNLSTEEELLNSIDGIMYEYSKHKNRLQATKAIISIIQKEVRKAQLQPELINNQSNDKSQRKHSDNKNGKYMIPQKKDNPTGLYGKYYIRKVLDKPQQNFFGDISNTEDVHPDSEYFVLRLDDLCKDKIHLDACRKAILYYAELIKDHLPKLSKDLIERYGK